MLVKSAVAVLALASAVAAAPRNGNRNANVGAVRQKGVHYKDGIFPAPKVDSAAASSNTLTYYGGPVVSNVQINPIYYGGSVNYQSQIDTFYSAIAGSTYISMLSEYDTPTQNIGAGSFGGSISKSSGLSTSTTDTAIQTWLRSLVQSGSIKPTANTYFPIHFAPGYSISMGSDSSCVQFCAYHGTIDISDISSTQYLYYGVLPDQGGACAGGCGSNPSTINNLQSVSSHELAETITDAAVGVATGSTLGAPLAWYNSANGEIGDICNAQQGSVIGTDGNSYVVQKLWSNAHNACYLPSGSPPPPPPPTSSKTTTTKTTTGKSTTTTPIKTTTTKTTTAASPTSTSMPHSGNACPTFGQYACGDQNDVLVCVNTWIQLTVCPSGTKCSPGSYVCI